VKAVSVNGVEASTDNILANLYPIARPFNVVTKGELTNPIAVDFLAFILSLEGQAVVTEDGLVSVATGETKSYAASGLSGTLAVGGSTSVAPVMEILAEAYMEINPGVQVDIQSTGSTAGVTGALDMTYDIGMASRALKTSETEAGALALAIGIDGIAVIANPENPVEDLSLEQVRQLFTGEITSWADIQK
jgi:phosphate transport system substrate-binding protein